MDKYFGSSLKYGEYLGGDSNFSLSVEFRILNKTFQIEIEFIITSEYRIDNFTIISTPHNREKIFTFIDEFINFTDQNVSMENDIYATLIINDNGKEIQLLKYSPYLKSFIFDYTDSDNYKVFDRVVLDDEKIQATRIFFRLFEINHDSVLRIANNELEKLKNIGWFQWMGSFIW